MVIFSVSSSAGRARPTPHTQHTATQPNTQPNTQPRTSACAIHNEKLAAPTVSAMLLPMSTSAASLAAVKRASWSRTATGRGPKPPSRISLRDSTPVDSKPPPAGLGAYDGGHRWPTPWPRSRCGGAPGAMATAGLPPGVWYTGCAFNLVAASVMSRCKRMSAVWHLVTCAICRGSGGGVVSEAVATAAARKAQRGNAPAPGPPP